MSSIQIMLRSTTIRDEEAQLLCGLFHHGSVPTLEQTHGRKPTTAEITAQLCREYEPWFTPLTRGESFEIENALLRKGGRLAKTDPSKPKSGTKKEDRLTKKIRSAKVAKERRATQSTVAESARRHHLSARTEARNQLIIAGGGEEQDTSCSRCESNGTCCNWCGYRCPDRSCPDCEFVDVLFDNHDMIDFMHPNYWI